jgi:DedD protein
VERPVKERLVGAAVLMAAAVILIPEMLSGPDRDSTGRSAEAGEGTVKTYTIDLSQSPGAATTVSRQGTDNRAPPPEESLSSAAPPADRHTPGPRAQPEPTPAAPAPTPAEGAPAPIVEAPQPQPQPKPEPPQQTARTEATPQPKPQAKPEAPPKPVASAPNAPTSLVPTGKGWAVQLGSYSSEATAQRLMSEWRAKGQNAFVMPVTAGGKTLYRVRIGPTRDREAAESTLKSVKASIPGAAVVAHP